MSTTLSRPEIRSQAYGQRGLSLVDRFGVYLSRRAVERVLRGRRGLHALDLGCGYRATLLQALGPVLEHGLGIDVRIAPELRDIPNLSFLETTIEESLPVFSEGSFDLVLMNSVLEHLRDPLFVLEQCRRLSRPGAAVLVNVPTWRGKAFLEYSAFRLGTSPADEMDDHKMYYDKRDLWPLLVRAGFLPSQLQLHYHKFGLNLFAIARVPGPGGRA